MSDKFDYSHGRKPRPSGSDSLLHAGDHHGRTPPQNPVPRKPGKNTTLL